MVFKMIVLKYVFSFTELKAVRAVRQILRCSTFSMTNVFKFWGSSFLAFFFCYCCSIMVLYMIKTDSTLFNFFNDKCVEILGKFLFGILFFVVVAKILTLKI